MSESLIKTIFIILGTLLVSIIVYLLIFTPTGQQFLWNTIEPAMINQWEESSMDSGRDRTAVYDSEFAGYMGYDR